MTNTTLKDVLEFVRSSTLEQRNAIVTALKFARDNEAFNAKLNLHKGMRVEFDHPQHGLITGRIEKINAKTVAVKSDALGIWRVPPQILREVV